MKKQTENWRNQTIKKVSTDDLKLEITLRKGEEIGFFKTKPEPKKWEKDLREKLASIEHIRWADWQKYLHSVCIKESNGDLTISAKSVKHWERQIATDYKDLTEKEKDSDREQVDRYFYLIQKVHTQAKNKKSKNCEK